MQYLPYPNTVNLMKRSKKIAVLILIMVGVFQFVQPTKNRSEGLGDADISLVLPISKELHQTFINKCYDCHSNNTRYPWYINVQPIGWWLAAHIHEGKEHLNFSNFKNYPPDKASHKLEEIGEVIEDGSMPIWEYTIFHKGAVITPAEKQAINAWLKSTATK
jgi:hypothetical protein